MRVVPSASKTPSTIPTPPFSTRCRIRAVRESFEGKCCAATGTAVSMAAANDNKVWRTRGIIAGSSCEVVVRVITTGAHARRDSPISPERLGRLDPKTPPSGSDRREEPYPDHEGRDGEQGDGLCPVHGIIYREHYRRRHGADDNADRELAQRTGEDAHQELARLGPQGRTDPDLPPGLSDGEGHERVDPGRREE